MQVRIRKAILRVINKRVGEPFNRPRLIYPMKIISTLRNESTQCIEKDCTDHLPHCWQSSTTLSSVKQEISGTALNISFGNNAKGALNGISHLSRSAFMWHYWRQWHAKLLTAIIARPLIILSKHDFALLSNVQQLEHCCLFKRTLHAWKYRIICSLPGLWAPLSFAKLLELRSSLNLFAGTKFFGYKL